MNVAEVNPLKLPSLPLIERRYLPDCSAIYFVMQGDCVLYIGRTGSLVQRWTTHDRWKQFKSLASDVRIAWLECSDTDLLSKIESALIEQFSPLLNGTPLEGVRKKPKVTIYLTEAHKAELHRWAEEEKRSISNLVELLLEKILSDRTPPPPSQTEPPKQGQRQMTKREKGKEG